MSTAYHYVKLNDLLPPLTVRCTYRDGTVVDLSAATNPRFAMAEIGETAKVDAVATIDDPVNGVISYQFAGADTDTIGRYRAEFQVTLAGRKITFPNDGWLTVVILEDVAA